MGSNRGREGRREGRKKGKRLERDIGKKEEKK
jgi:hypothetical protein